MKKFWKIFAIVLSAIIIIGLGLLFIPNNFAMFNVISQNKEKSINVIGKSLELFGTEEIKSYNFKTELFLKEEDGPETEFSVDLQLVKTDDSYEFIIIERLSIDDVEDNKNLFYKNGFLYVNDITAQTSVKMELSFEEAFNQANLALYIGYIFPQSINNTETFDLKASMKLNFTESFIGQNYKFVSEYTTVTYTVDLWGNLRLYKFEQVLESEEIKNETKVFTTKPNLVFPADLNDYELVD